MRCRNLISQRSTLKRFQKYRTAQNTLKNENLFHFYAEDEIYDASIQEIKLWIYSERTFISSRCFWTALKYECFIELLSYHIAIVQFMKYYMKHTTISINSRPVKIWYWDILIQTYDWVYRDMNFLAEILLVQVSFRLSKVLFMKYISCMDKIIRAYRRQMVVSRQVINGINTKTPLEWVFMYFANMPLTWNSSMKFFGIFFCNFHQY